MAPTPPMTPETRRAVSSSAMKREPMTSVTLETQPAMLQALTVTGAVTGATQAVMQVAAVIVSMTAMIQFQFTPSRAVYQASHFVASSDPRNLH